MKKKFISLLSIFALMVSQVTLFSSSTFAALNLGSVITRTASNQDSFKINDYEIDLSQNEKLQIDFDLEESAYVHVEVERTLVADTQNNVYKVYGERKSAGNVSIDWYGKKSPDSTSNEKVETGCYQLKVYAFNYIDPVTTEIQDVVGTPANNSFSLAERVYENYDYRTATMRVVDSAADPVFANSSGCSATPSNPTPSNPSNPTPNTDGKHDDGDIRDFELDPDETWEVDEDGDLEITWEFEEDVDDYRLFVEELDGDEVVELVDRSSGNDGDYFETWNGRDDDGNLVNEATYKVILEAEEENGSDTFRVYDYIKVRYDDNLGDNDFDLEAFVVHPKTEEYNYLILRIEDDRDDPELTVDLLEGSRTEEELVDDEEIEEDVWYIVENEDEMDDGNWRFFVDIEGDDDETRRYVHFRVDDLDDITKFEFPLVVFDEDRDDPEDAEVEFCIEDDAENVTIEVFRGQSVSGTREEELYDEDDLDEGCYSVTYDDIDDLRDGAYTMRLTYEEEDRNNRYTQTLRFAVGEKEFLNSPGIPKPGSPDPVKPGNPNPQPIGTCGGFTDTVNLASTDPELCAAYEFAKEQKIMFGYSNGTVGGDRLINRAELAAVVFRMYEKANELVLLTGKSFPDVDPNAWYGPYARTLNFHGIIHGDSDTGKLRPNDNANIAEASKIFWEAGDAFAETNLTRAGKGNYLDVPSRSWYENYAGLNYDFEIISGNQMYPGKYISRAEVARMIYRMYQAGKL